MTNDADQDPNGHEGSEENHPSPNEDNNWYFGQLGAPFLWDFGQLP